jgi:hypothetical protein
MRAFQTIFLFSAVLGLLSCGGGGAVSLCEASQYGVSTSLPDNTAVFQAALHSCAGRTMHVPTGTYKFAPALAYPDTNGFGNGIAIPDGTSIVGDGPGRTVLQIEGPGNYASFLWIQDAGNLSLRDLTFVGNNARDPPPPAGAPACTYDYGHAIFIRSTKRPIGNISIVESEFISFTGTSWINVLGGGSAIGIGVEGGPVTIEGNHFKSVQGNAVAPEHIVCPASAVAIQGLGPAVSTANVIVSGNVIEADYIKTGIAVWSGASDITITNNTIENAGQGLPVPVNYSNGSYAILIYQQHAVPPSTMVFVRPTAISILDNEIVSPYSSGIYIAGGRNVGIVGNYISGQIDKYDVTEPRGAIALNELNNDFDSAQTAIKGNHISDSAVGISIAGGVLPIVDSNVIDTIPSGGTGIKVDGMAIDGVTLTLTNTIISARKNAANVSSLIGFFPLEALTIDGLYQTGAAYPLRWYTDVVGTPQQPQQGYCSFRAFGSIKRVFTADPLCPSSDECWTAQAGYWPYYGVGCS